MHSENENLPTPPQEPYLLGKEFGPMFKQQNIHTLIIRCRRNYSIFFDMQECKDKTVELLNFGESKMIFIFIIGLTTSGRKPWQKEKETRSDTSIVLICQEQFCTSEFFEVIQDAAFIDLSLKDNVIILDCFFKYIYHVECAINFHSIINSGLILVEQHLSNTQTVSFLLMNSMDKEHKDLDTIDLEAPRFVCTVYAQSMEETSKYFVLG